MLPVWTDLTDADGCEMHFKDPAMLGLPCGTPVTWAQVRCGTSTPSTPCIRPRPWHTYRVWCAGVVCVEGGGERTRGEAAGKL
eukprot:366255-Chlamydomonas_euryale.AAC.5